MKSNWVLFVFLFSVFLNIEAQELKNIGIEIRPKYGFVLPHRAIMSHLVQGHSSAIEVAYVNQTAGTKEWESRFSMPRYGVALYFSGFGNREVLGSGVGSFGFIELPIFRLNSWMFGGKLTAGLSYVTRKYDAVDNPKNNAIGSHVNSLVVVGAVLSKQLIQGELSLGIDMTHLSNGAAVLPNLGLNIPYLSLGYTRYLNPLIFGNDLETNEMEIETHRIYSSLNFSTKQIYPTGGRNYFVGSIFTYYHHQFSRKAALDVGLDMIFNASHRDLKSEAVKFMDVAQIGVFAGYVLPVNAFEYVLGMGYYVRNPINPNGPVYHRFGFRYKVSERIKLNVCIKSHWGKADYFEYGIIYRWH